jgi:hypothetical protein
MSDEHSDEPFAEEDAEEDAPQIPNLADPTHHRRIRDAGKREAAEAKAFWTEVFASEIGRREAWKTLELTGFFAERYAVASPTGFPDPLATYALTGEQRVGKRMFIEWMRLCQEGVVKMLAEHHPDLRPPPKPPRRYREF